MGLHYENLDEVTRTFMIEELDIDIANGKSHKFICLNEFGETAWVLALREAMQAGNDDSLESAILQNGFLKDTFVYQTFGGSRTREVTQYDVLRISEDPFNQYYARAICRRAINEGLKKVEIYGARAISNLEEERHFQKFFGNRVDAYKTLNDLRNQTSACHVEKALGVPAGSPRGLSLRLFSQKKRSYWPKLKLMTKSFLLRF